MEEESPLVYRSYGSRQLSEAEILLTQLYERQEKFKHAALLEAQAERKLLGTVAASLSYRTVINTAAGLNKAAAAAEEEKEKEKEKEREAAAAATKVEEEAKTDTAGHPDVNKPAARNRPSAQVSDAPARSAPGKAQGQELDSIFDQYAAAAADEDSQLEGADEEDVEAPHNDFVQPAASRVRPSAGHEAVRLRKKQRSAEEEAEEEAEVIVDLDTLDSSALYASGYLRVEDWDPKTATASQSYPLLGFGMVPEGGSACGDADARPNNTLVVQLTVPAKPKRWSVNICPEGGADSHILLHFNPRYNKGKLVLNDKQVFWGAGRSVPMRADTGFGSRGAPRGAAALNSSSVELLISVRETGFACFVNGQCACFFPHRSDISDLQRLVCVLPRCDDNGVVESALFQKVWWGYRDPALDPLPPDVVGRAAEEVEMFRARQAKKRQAGAPAQDDAVSSCTLQVTGLPKHSDNQEIRQLETALMSMFEEFKPVNLNIAPGAGVGYILFPSVDYCLDALDGMQGVGLTDEKGEVHYLDIARLAKKF